MVRAQSYDPNIGRNERLALDFCQNRCNVLDVCLVQDIEANAILEVHGSDLVVHDLILTRLQDPCGRLFEHNDSFRSQRFQNLLAVHFARKVHLDPVSACSDYAQG